MTSVNSINVNTQGVGGSFGFNAKAKAEEKEKSEGGVVTTGQQPQVSADDVFSFMAQSAVSVTPSSIASIDTSKYVDKESAARIAGFMSQFEDIVATNLTAIAKEFPGISDSSAQALALAQAGE